MLDYQHKNLQNRNARINGVFINWSFNTYHKIIRSNHHNIFNQKNSILTGYSARMLLLFNVLLLLVDNLHTYHIVPYDDDSHQNPLPFRPMTLPHPMTDSESPQFYHMNYT